MPRGDAVQQQPTVEEEMAKFKGFSTTDGEVSDGSDTPEEKAAAEQRAKASEQAAATAAAQASARAAEEGKQSQQQQAASAAQAGSGNKADDAAGDVTAKAGEAKTYKDLRGVSYDDLQPGDFITVADARKMASHRVNKMRRENGDLERRLAAIEARGAGPDLTQRRAAATTVADNDRPPDPSKYEFGEVDPKYIDALVDYRTNQILNKREQASRQTAAERQQQAAAEEFSRKVDEFGDKGAEKYDDFHEVVVEGGRNGDWPLPEVVGQMLFESEFGPDIAYHLATHLGDARKVEKMTAAQQRVWFARQEAQLSAAAAAEAGKTTQESGPEGQQKAGAVKTTKAPPPPEQQARGQGTAQPVDGSTSDFAAFERIAMGGK